MEELMNAPWWEEFINEGTFVSFEEAKNIAKSAGITSQSQYQKWTNRPERMPSNPHQTYKDEWISWYDFLGTEKATFLTYKEAVQFLRDNFIATRDQYRNHKTKRLPANPDTFYKDWTGWSDFLGIKKSKFLSYEEAVKLARECDISSSREYQFIRTITNGLPSKPHITYKEQWNGWGEFLSK
jgi:hypothetical protein